MKLPRSILLLSVLLAMPVFAGGDGSATRKAPPGAPEQVPYRPAGEHEAKDASSARKEGKQSGREAHEPVHPSAGKGSTGTYRRPPIPEDME